MLPANTQTQKPLLDVAPTVLAHEILMANLSSANSNDHFRPGGSDEPVLLTLALHRETQRQLNGDLIAHSQSVNDE